MLIPKALAKTKVMAKKRNISNWDAVEDFISINYELRNNVISSKIEFRIKGAEGEWVDLNPDDIFRSLQKNKINFSLSHLNSMLQSDFVEKYNPIKNYFEALDSIYNDYKLKVGSRNLVDELCEFIKTDDDQKFKKHFQKMLVRTIACALNPKIVNKQAFILVDENQNTGKTSFLRWLCPESLNLYYTESMSLDKDGLIALGGNFIINLDELAVFSKSDINYLKSLMSLDKIKQRLPYGKRPVMFPRVASFIGSTNKTDFLTDETGSVRWLCFQLIEQINFAYREQININELWYYAYQLYKSGFNYELTKAEIIENEISNQKFKEQSPEFELVMKYFNPSSKEDYGEFKTTSEITEILLSNTGINIKSNAVGKALTMLGFKKDQKFDPIKKYPCKGYYVKLKI